MGPFTRMPTVRTGLDRPDVHVDTGGYRHAIDLDTKPTRNATTREGEDPTVNDRTACACVRVCGGRWGGTRRATTIGSHHETRRVDANLADGDKASERRRAKSMGRTSALFRVPTRAATAIPSALPLIFMVGLVCLSAAVGRCVHSE